MNRVAGLRAAWRRLTASTSDLDTAEQERSARLRGAVPPGEAVPRSRARVYGEIASVTYRPRQQTPALVARLADGAGSVDLVFIGRREVPGLEPGRRLVAEGMVTAGRGRPVMFNPAYDLDPREGAP